MKKFIIIIVLLFVVSCNQKSDSKIGKKINEKCIEKNCVINMADIVSGDWDYMYVFQLGMSQDQVNSKLGFKYPFFEDVASRVIFINNNEVVYHEDEFPNPEKIKKGELYFESGNSNYLKIPREKAIFIVTKTDGYYQLDLKNIK